MLEITCPKTEYRKKNGGKKYEDSLTDLQDNIKRNNIHITGVPEGEEREGKNLRKYLKG